MTPFTITYSPLTVAGVDYPTTSAPITLTGTLTGSVTGNQSSVRATFNSMSSARRSPPPTGSTSAP